MAEHRKNSDRRQSPWQAWKAFGLRHSRPAALSVFVFAMLTHAVLSHVFSTAHADEIEALLGELYVFQCVPLDAPSGPRPTPAASRLRELDVTSVRVLLIERAVEGLGDHRDEAARVVADVLRYDRDLNARAGAVLALSHMGAGAGRALPDLLDTVANADEDIRLRRLILDRLPAMDPSPDAVVPILAAMLESESDPRMRTKVAKALTEIGATPAR